MGNRTTLVEEGDNFWDKVVQCYGSVEGALMLLKDNGIPDFNAVLRPGTKLNYSELPAPEIAEGKPRSAPVQEFFDIRKIRVRTGREAPNDYGCTDGIENWSIEEGAEGFHPFTVGQGQCEEPGCVSTVGELVFRIAEISPGQRVGLFHINAEGCATGEYFVSDDGDAQAAASWYLQFNSVEWLAVEVADDTVTILFDFETYSVVNGYDYSTTKFEFCGLELFVCAFNSDDSPAPEIVEYMHPGPNGGGLIQCCSEPCDPDKITFGFTILETAPGRMFTYPSISEYDPSEIIVGSLGYGMQNAVAEALADYFNSGISGPFITASHSGGTVEVRINVSGFSAYYGVSVEWIRETYCGLRLWTSVFEADLTPVYGTILYADPHPESGGLTHCCE